MRQALKHYSVPAVNDARQAEAKAKAALRKACAAADPASVVIDASPTKYRAGTIKRLDRDD